jgi:hypothetical protein
MAAHRGLFVGKWNPIAVFLRKVPPTTVDVEAECHQNVSLVLASPSRRPSRDRPLPYRQAIVGRRTSFRDVIKAAGAVTFVQAPSGLLVENASPCNSAAGVYPPGHGCNPVVGSSSTQSVLPRCILCNSVVSLIRCASPPESSVAG